VINASPVRKASLVQAIDSVHDFLVVMAVVTGVDYISHVEDVFYEYVETPRVTRVFQQKVGLYPLDLDQIMLPQ
jgi:hypothetical protein